VAIGIISSDKVVFGLAVGIPVLIVGLVVVWAKPRRRSALWALISLAAIAGTAVGAWAAFQGSAPTTPVSTVAAPPPAPPPPQPSPSPSAPPSSPSAAPSSPSPQPSAPCSPSGTQLSIAAQGIAFSTDCLAAPADTAITIAFDNEDAGVPHNIHIYSEDPTKNPDAESLFSGDLVTGPDTTTYQVNALPAGTYFFHCDVHPTQMFGTFVSG
jgi:plastocyanin